MGSSPTAARSLLSVQAGMDMCSYLPGMVQDWEAQSLASAFSGVGGQGGRFYR